MLSDIEQLRLTQSQGAVDILSTLRTVEINPIEICNRSCSFCPRSDNTIYPNRKFKIEKNVIEKIANDLKSFNYSGRIGFVGFGEPMLLKELNEYITIIKTVVDTAQWIEVNTNGDYLTRETARDLVKAGCTHITVSMYDKDDSIRFEEIVRDLPVKLTLRHQYDSTLSYNINIVNRIDLSKKDSQILNIDKTCFLPFYKLFIDYNGDVLVCNNDWGRNSNLGNVLNQSVSDIWLSKQYNEYRKKLMIGHRYNCSPCNRCNIKGNTYGDQSVEIFRKTFS